MSWTREIVLDELIRAFEVDDALPVRVGPRAYGSAMPDFVRDAADRFMAGADADAETREIAHRRAARRSLVTAASVSHAEAVFGWVVAFVPDVELRHVLFGFAMCRARKWDWNRYIRRRNNRNPTKKPWSRQTTYRWLSRAQQQVADGLDKRGVPLPPGADLQVRHERAEITPDPDRTGSGAWSAPGRAA